MRGFRSTANLALRSVVKRPRRFLSTPTRDAGNLSRKPEELKRREGDEVHVGEGVATVVADDYDNNHNNNDDDEQPEAPNGFWRRMRPHLIAATVAAVAGTLYFQWAFIGHAEPYKRLIDFVSQCEEVTESIGKVSEYKYYHPMSFVQSSGIWDMRELSWAGEENLGMADECRCWMKLYLQGDTGGYMYVDAEMRKFEAGVSGWKPWSVTVSLYPAEAEGQPNKEPQVVTLLHHEYEYPRGMDQLISHQ